MQLIYVNCDDAADDDNGGAGDNAADGYDGEDDQHILWSNDKLRQTMMLITLRGSMYLCIRYAIVVTDFQDKLCLTINFMMIKNIPNIKKDKVESKLEHIYEVEENGIHTPSN